MSLTVKQIREIIPLADVYEVRPGARYLVRVDKTVPQNMVAHLATALADNKVDAVLFSGDDLTFYELK